MARRKQPPVAIVADNALSGLMQQGMNLLGGLMGMAGEAAKIVEQVKGTTIAVDLDPASPDNPVKIHLKGRPRDPDAQLPPSPDLPEANPAGGRPRRRPARSKR